MTKKTPIFKSKKEFKEKIGMTPLELSRKIRKETNEELNNSPIKFDKWEVLKNFNAMMSIILIFLFGFSCGAWFW